VHEASNRRRWWFRHKVRETSIEPSPERQAEDSGMALRETLVDAGESPLQALLHGEVRARVEQELKQLQEPYRTTVILRDIEEMSYEQIAEVMNVSLGTVKSRLVRGRDGLRKRLERYARELGPEFGLRIGKKPVGAEPGNRANSVAQGTREIEVQP
jgi:RNA polymerase sigma-70 factor (ECF subfamily)